jgi:hypothetical protein
VDGTTKRVASTASAKADSPVTQKAFNWFTRILPLSFFDSLKQDLEIVENSCIFTLPVTVWTMILQRLSTKGTLASAVGELVHGNGRALLSPCKRVVEDNISTATGAYSQARQRVPVEAVRRIAERTFEYLHSLAEGSGSLRDRLFILDGSSIRLSHTAALIRAYPEAENQHGKSHWPVMRIAVAHHVVTGLAMAPRFGPMYGPDAVSEQSLANQLITRLPPASVLIGDRNFGIFGVAWCASSHGHKVVIRLTAERARRLSAGELVPQSDREIIWEPSRDDRRTWPQLPAGAHIEGRLIVIRPQEAKDDLYLFTTLDAPVAQIGLLYKERWSIETDLRSLKEQVRLHTIAARSPDLVASELLIAIASYNLIRSVMTEAARQITIDPRRLSFSRCSDSFWAFARAAAHLESQEKFEYHWRLLLRSLSQCKLPKRHRPPAPRAVWPKPQNFPTRKVQP